MTRALAGLALGLAALSCAAQDPGTLREVQRALIQRDQQSAEFAAGVRGAPDRAALETLHSQQLRDAGRALPPDPALARALQPYERNRMADERGMLFSPPVARVVPPPPPLPLPSGAAEGVDVIPVQSTRD